jgi:hypothetical protein
VAFGATASSAAIDPNAFGRSFHYCGAFKAEYEIGVFAKKITCAKARRIQREYWLGPRSRKIIRNGGYGASGYILLKRYPGWKCTSGSGGGQCAKSKSVAAYQN